MLTAPSNTNIHTAHKSHAWQKQLPLEKLYSYLKLQTLRQSKAQKRQTNAVTLGWSYKQRDWEPVLKACGNV